MAKGRFISYLRVSTQRQGANGLGIEAQRQAVMDFLNGGRWELIAEFVEVESGKRDDRPELAKALAACRVHGATLVIAKLDRLSRDAAFLFNLQKAGVCFVCADMPDANELTVGLLAVVAQHERKMISERTKAALAAAKARGKALGNPKNLSEQARVKGRALGSQALSERAAARARDLAPLIAELRAEGFQSAHSLAKKLNDDGVPTPSGRGKWQAVTVQRVMERADRAAA